MMKIFCLQRKHSSNLKAFSDFVATQKRTLEPPEIPDKQATISYVMAVGTNKRVPQAKVDKLTINLICEVLHPFSLVEQPAFNKTFTYNESSMQGHFQTHSLDQN